MKQIKEMAVGQSLVVSAHDVEKLAEAVWELWEGTSPKATKQVPEKLKALASKYRDKIDKGESSSGKPLDDGDKKLLNELMTKLGKAIAEDKDIRRIAYQLAIKFGRRNVPLQKDIYGYPSFGKGDTVYFRSKQDHKIYKATLTSVDAPKPAEVAGMMVSFFRGEETSGRIFPEQLIAPANVPSSSKTEIEKSVKEGMKTSNVNLAKRLLDVLSRAELDKKSPLKKIQTDIQKLAS